MATSKALKMTPTCAAVVGHYAGIPAARAAVDRMRSDVFLKAQNRSKTAGWLQDIEEWPYTAVTEAGRAAVAED